MSLDKILMYCNFSKRYQGYQELKECISIALEEEERLMFISGIYIDVAKKHKILPSSVDRNIRTLITHAWKQGGKEPLETISGGKLYEKPSVSEVLEIIVCYIKEHGDDESFVHEQKRNL